MAAGGTKPAHGGSKHRTLFIPEQSAQNTEYGIQSTEHGTRSIERRIKINLTRLPCNRYNKFAYMKKKLYLCSAKTKRDEKAPVHSVRAEPVRWR